MHLFWYGCTSARASALRNVHTHTRTLFLFLSLSHTYTYTLIHTHIHTHTTPQAGASLATYNGSGKYLNKEAIAALPKQQQSSLMPGYNVFGAKYTYICNIYYVCILYAPYSIIYIWMHKHMYCIGAAFLAHAWLQRFRCHIYIYASEYALYIRKYIDRCIVWDQQSSLMPGYNVFGATYTHLQCICILYASHTICIIHTCIHYLRVSSNLRSCLAITLLVHIYTCAYLPGYNVLGPYIHICILYASHKMCIISA